MKRINKFLTRSAVALTVAAILPSCAMEAPFADRGEGNLTITTDIKGDVTKHTRAIGEDELSLLREKCVVYIENSKGVIRKYKGLDNIPESIRLRTGEYVAEAWSGDSVSASFDKKFYRGWEKFEITEGQNSLTLKCNIANVLVSVDPGSLGVNLTDLKVTFSHSRGLLEFTESNITDGAKGYFMMPNADKDLSYKVEGKKSDGSPFTKEGKIENVQRAHEYCMTLSEDERPVTEGGALIRLTIADIPVIEEDVEIFPAPAVRGDGFDIDGQVVSVERDFKDTRVYIRGFFGLSSVAMNVSGNFSGIGSYADILSGDAISELSAKGVVVERRESKDAAMDGADVKVDELYVTFTKAFLDALPASEQEYSVTFSAVDGQHKEGSASLRIANTEDAIDVLPPVVTAPAPDPASDPMAIGATHATLTANYYEGLATNYGIAVRERGQTEWNKFSASSAESSHLRRAGRTRATTAIPYTVNVTGLKAGTVYEYAAFADDYISDVIKTFSTESVFSIVNASFEDWSTYTAKTMLGTKTIILPGSTGDKLTSFWGSGNEGSMTANKTLTNKSTDMRHSGEYSARLASNEAMGILAAGNIFVGHYDRTDGTNGVLSLGREYNGTHPTKVRVYANYRPGSNVSIKDGNAGFCPDGFANGNDHGQIYVALTVGPVEIRTNPANRKLFNPDDEQVLAYGQVTWTEAFGPDGALQLVDIPFTYNERAKTKRPTHLVIVASASKYGDYFSGSSSSVMYLDDFELIYE